jgi:hypothetical protein
MMLTQLEMKQTLLVALEANDFETIRTLALQSRKVLSVLVRLAYDKTSLTGWRAIKAIGHVASLYVRNNYDFLRDTIRKLLWSLSDESGGIGWSAPEILGEIVSADPKKLADIVPLIAEVYSIEEKVFRPGVLYALKRIGEISPESIEPFQEIVLSGLSEEDPLARVYALELLMAIQDKLDSDALDKARQQVAGLGKDKTEVWIYKYDGFVGVEVGELAKKVQIELGK